MNARWSDEWKRDENSKRRSQLTIYIFWRFFFYPNGEEDDGGGEEEITIFLLISATGYKWDINDVSYVTDTDTLSVAAKAAIIEFINSLKKKKRTRKKFHINR